MSIAATQAWRERNKEHIREYKRNYRIANREQRSEYNKKYAEAHRAQIAKKAHEHYKANATLYAEKKQRRRAREVGAYVSPVSRLAICDRDDWICQLCGDPIQRDSVYPHPLSVSIDHIVPLAWGGTHEPNNVQCAHLSCNVKKGPRRSFSPADPLVSDRTP